VRGIGGRQQRDVLRSVADGEFRAHRWPPHDLALLHPARNQTGQLRPACGCHRPEKTAYDAFALFVELGVPLGLQHRRDELVSLPGVFDLKSDFPAA